MLASHGCRSQSVCDGPCEKPCPGRAWLSVWHVSRYGLNAIVVATNATHGRSIAGSGTPKHRCVTLEAGSIVCIEGTIRPSRDEGLVHSRGGYRLLPERS